MSRWLTEEGGSSGVTGGRNSSDSEFNASGSGVVPTVPDIQPIQTQSLAHVASQSAMITVSSVNSGFVPSSSVNNQTLAKLSNHSSSLVPPTLISAATHSLPNYHIVHPSSSINQPYNNATPADNIISEQLLPNNNPDKSIISQLPPTNDTVFTALSLPSIITDNINHHSLFSFQSTQLAYLDRVPNPLNRPSKINPNQKMTQTLSNPNRFNHKKNTSDPKKNPVNPKPMLNQKLSEDMEVQTEKKRRREEAKKESDGNSESSKHFLSAGPDSQVCRDQ
jgi:hypothetical protein